MKTERVNFLNNMYILNSLFQWITKPDVHVVLGSFMQYVRTVCVVMIQCVTLLLRISPLPLFSEPQKLVYKADTKASVAIWV